VARFADALRAWRAGRLRPSAAAKTTPSPSAPQPAGAPAAADAQPAVGGQFDVLCNNAGVIFDVCVRISHAPFLHL
jgi:hypothetical protein